MHHPPHILVIVGSTRQGRNGDTAVTWLMSRLNAQSDATFEVVDLRDLALPFFDTPVSPAHGPVAAEARTWADRVSNADGFIFVMPEYNHGYPAPLKNAIDYLYNEWAHKPAAIVSYGGLAGGSRAAEQLRLVLVELKTVPVREQVGIATVSAAFDEAGRPRNAALDRALEAMMTELLWWAVSLIPARERDRAALEFLADRAAA
jgi:NAD(P)H-dependent FMN reductase